MPEQTFGTIEEAKAQVQIYKKAGYPYARVGKGILSDTYKAYSGRREYTVARQTAGLSEIEEPEPHTGYPPIERIASALQHAEKQEVTKREMAIERTQRRAEGRTFRLSPEIEPYLEAELKARERRRIEAGTAPGMEVGRLRWIGQIPVKVSPKTRELIGQREMANVIAAQEAKESIRKRIEELEKTKEEAVNLKETAAENLRTAQERNASPEDIYENQQDYDEAERILKTIESEGVEIDKRLSEVEKTIATKGAYSPGVRSALVVEGRISEAVGGFLGGTTRHIMERGGHTKGAMKESVRQMTGAGGQPAMRIATVPTETGEPQIRIAGLPRKQPGVIGMERPAIGTMGEAQVSPAPTMSPEEKGFATKTESPLKAAPSTEIDLSKLRDTRYGEHL